MENQCHPHRVLTAKDIEYVYNALGNRVTTLYDDALAATAGATTSSSSVPTKN
ncbi:MAG: hypothetical protein GY778_13755 [bacterium]|nr:hypothetical protein [bacterium]